MRVKSLASRLFVFTALWSVVAIGLIAFLVSESYRANAERNLSARLTANLYNIMGSVSLVAEGQIFGQPDLRDPRFQRFRSGYYWSVTDLGNPANEIRSESLAGADVPVPVAGEYDDNFQRQFIVDDQTGNRLLGIEAQAFLGEGNDIFRFVITANQSEVDQEVSEFVRRLLFMLSVFALGFILASYFIVRLALAPVRVATERLSDIREGRADYLEGRFPDEIQPFLDETNTLIRSNNAVIDRARTQVGNLAHSMKTPLAVLKNEAEKLPLDKRKIVDEQVAIMQAQVQNYLDRARISARTGTITSRTPLAPALDRLVRVMRKLNSHLRFELEPADDELTFGGEQQDLEEMVGNLLENAAKFAKKTVRITCSTARPGRVHITVADDGPGLSGEDAERAMQRGTRLDETKPGSGLGLSIVKDIANEYGGKVELQRASIGGVAAVLDLPAAN